MFMRWLKIDTHQKSSASQHHSLAFENPLRVPNKDHTIAYSSHISTNLSRKQIAWKFSLKASFNHHSILIPYLLYHKATDNFLWKPVELFSYYDVRK